MQRYPLGNFSVSRIGFGAMQLPGPGVFGPPRDRDEALAVLRRAAELGVDHIDTAQYYGPDVANELIRAALFPYPGTLALVSKVGARRDGSGGWLPYSEPAQLRQGIEDNLRSLGVDQLAAVNLRLTDGTPPGHRFDDQLAAMIQARDEGLIGGVGLSNATPEVPLLQLVQVGHTRWPVEDCFLQGKQEVGLDAYEVRGWLGWHHHMTLVLLALWFLKLETRRLGGKSGRRHHVA